MNWSAASPAGADIESIVVAAIVATLVTTIIEFLAKPFFEVRKERVLAKHKAVWELERALRLFTTRLGRASLPIGLEGDSKAISDFALYLSDEAREIENRVVTCEGSIPKSVAGSIHYGLGFHAALVDVADLIARSDLTDAHRALVIEFIVNALGTNFDQPADYFATSSWRVFRRLNLRWKMRGRGKELKMMPGDRARAVRSTKEHLSRITSLTTEERE
jgi:hypothetical protein